MGVSGNCAHKLPIPGKNSGEVKKQIARFSLPPHASIVLSPVRSSGLAAESSAKTRNPRTPDRAKRRIISAGYGIDLTDKVQLESDFEWLQFSQFKNLGIKTGDFPALGGASLTQNVAENWHNTFTAGIGGDWKFADHWVLRAGYEYFESPVPNSTFSPTIPDANQNVMTVGLRAVHNGAPPEAQTANNPHHISASPK